MPALIKIHFEPLHIPMRTSFKQASFTRKVGESVWAVATRGALKGYGEGCPRHYVTGEEVASSLEYLLPIKEEIENECISLEALRQRVKANELSIDQHPAAWCAVETALLDLFAKEQGKSVEALLGLKNPTIAYQYTAVLGDSDASAYEALVSRYLKWGFEDFKIKLNGHLQKDKDRLSMLIGMCEQAGLQNFQIRVDANNLWADNTSAAIDHLSGLDFPFSGIEEPIEVKNPEGLAKISRELGTPVILDESLTNLGDLRSYDPLSGAFIGNIKVSKLGGVLRSMAMVKALKERHWKIIVGAHVGETSVMTRAGMCVAQYIGDQLIGHEGCFGTRLLEYEPVAPSLMFGAKGTLDLSRPYIIESESGPETYPVTRWKSGWGLEPGNFDQDL